MSREREALERIMDLHMGAYYDDATRFYEACNIARAALAGTPDDGPMIRLEDAAKNCMTCAVRAGNFTHVPLAAPVESPQPTPCADTTPEQAIPCDTTTTEEKP